MFEKFPSPSHEPVYVLTPAVPGGDASLEATIRDEASRKSLRSKAILGAYGLLAGLAMAFSLLFLPQGENWFLAIFALLTIIVMRSDIESYLIPDWASLAIGILGLLHGLLPSLEEDSGPNGMKLSADLLIHLLPSLANGLFAFTLFYVIARLYHAYAGREGLGFGDVKLAGALAVWLDPFTFALVLQLATFPALITIALCAVLRRPQGILPFGAFLAPAAWILAAVITLEPGLWGMLP